jgi:phosphoribosyl-ATP pyrophosphohydrolase
MKSLTGKAEIINHCASSNSECFNLLKVLEEIGEFQEVATKLSTKHPDNPEKPKKEELIKEFGDLIYRGVVYLKQQFPELSVQEIEEKLDARVGKKLSKLEEWKKDGLYKTGL